MLEPSSPEEKSQREFERNVRTLHGRDISRLELAVLAIFSILAWHSCQITKMEKRQDATERSGVPSPR